MSNIYMLEEMRGLCSENCYITTLTTGTIISELDCAIVVDGIAVQYQPSDPDQNPVVMKMFVATEYGYGYIFTSPHHLRQLHNAS